MSSKSVEITAVAGFVRQLTHDIRNHLNGLDLEAALLGEIVTDAEATESVGRLRGQIRGLADELRTLSAKFAGGELCRAPIEAQEIVLIWQDRATALGLDSIEWTSHLKDERIDIDVAAIDIVLKELLANAKHFTGATGMKISAGAQDGEVAYELQEPKSKPVDPQDWGSQPFRSSKRGGYGLGLWRVAQTVAASGGKITRAFLPEGTLVTKISFPRI